MQPIPQARSLAHLPLPLLAIPLGLGGLGLAWRHMQLWPVSEALMALTALAWAGLLGLHLWRAFRHREAALADWRNPLRCGFVGAASIGMMLTAAGLSPYWAAGARGLLLLAITLHLAIGLALLARVLRGEGSAAMLVPPLLIPLVGNVLAPIFCAPLGLEALGWMLFGVGMLLWLGLQPLLLGRLFEAPLPPPLRPSLAILLAPSAVGALAIEALGGPLPAFLALYGLAAFTFALLLMVLRPMLGAGFALSYWAFTFPLAAFATATMKIAPGWIGLGMLAIATLVIGAIAAATLRLAFSGALLRPPLLPPR
ncbi:C4-dicarboxylate ABC transporter [Sediminicoccus sp. KRV36]|uniref:SLAC1 family transporter n=1 Tax=Sediminicoccus sp. KRV36 TaxID=3133721 RepID=UPI00200D6BD6|nr:C4-dicarboxylate ABC transporter [Sediminicoccus rosea]UPY39347.1 C4-dicarboxylate ABC transporter [Sediminicoccus rosea]